MIIYYIFFIVTVSVLLIVTIKGKDAYPFSHYPMFAAKNSVSKIRVYRIALEKQTGEVEWWKHEAYRYPEIIGDKLANFYFNPTNENKKEILLKVIQRKRLLSEAVRLIELQVNCSLLYKAFHIVERTVNDQLEIHDNTVEIILFSEIARAKVS